MMLDIAIVDASKYTFKWAEIVDGFKFFACHDAQLDILASRAKYTAAFFGTGSGKTAVLPVKIYKELDRARKLGHTGLWRCLVVSPSENTFLSSQLLQHIQTVFDDTKFHGTWNGKTKTYSGLNFELVVRTAQNDPKRLSGGQYDFIVVDEAFQMPDPDIFAEIRRRSNIKNAPVLIVTTPNVDGWLYEEIYQKWEAGDPEFYVRQCSTSANPAKSAEEHARFLESEKIKLGTARFERMYGGKFSQISGLVYEYFGDDKSPNFPVIKPMARLPRPAVRVFGSVDFGYFPDPFTAYVFVETDDEKVYCVEEIYDVRLEIDFIGSELRRLQDKWSNGGDGPYRDIIKGGTFDSWYCDASRPEVRQLIQRFGVSIRNRKIADISAGVAITDQVIRTKRLKVFSCCTNLIREARSYIWAGNKPKPGNDHAMDSLRYGISSFFDGRQITLIPDQVTTASLEDLDVERASRLGIANSREELEQAKRAAEEKELSDWLIKLQWAGVDD